jgi:hypothetical protein
MLVRSSFVVSFVLNAHDERLGVRCARRQRVSLGVSFLWDRRNERRSAVRPPLDRVGEASTAGEGGEALMVREGVPTLALQGSRDLQEFSAEFEPGVFGPVERIDDHTERAKPVRRGKIGDLLGYRDYFRVV